MIGGGWELSFYLGSADLMSTLRPLIVACWTLMMRSWATASSLKVTNPNPLDWPVFMSLRITALSMSPYCAKCYLSSSLVNLKSRPPTKILDLGYLKTISFLSAFPPILLSYVSTITYGFGLLTLFIYISYYGTGIRATGLFILIIVFRVSSIDWPGCAAGFLGFRFCIFGCWPSCGFT